MSAILLQAFKGTNKRVPVWFMRQAGRFLPEYQKIRQHHSLDEMFRDPAIVAEVTCQPVSILGVDAAILFADILTLPMQLGFDITFDPGKGPVIKNPFRLASDLKRLHHLDDVSHLRKAIPAINKVLPAEIPLIGFAGSPFTVLCYLVEGGSSKEFARVRWLIKEDPKTFHQLMKFLTTNTVKYLQLQKKAGIKVFQLFDSWGGILNEQEYKALVLPYVQTIFEKVDLPSIYFLKNCRHLVSSMKRAKSDFLSVCETVDLAELKTEKGVQGNLLVDHLRASDTVLKKEVLKVLNEAKKFKKYIFNLNHGIQPDVQVAKVQLVVQIAHDFKWKS